MAMSVENETALAKSLGTKFAANGITTKILCYDNNWDNYEYPIQVFSNTSVASYIAGSAFHCYAGNVTSQSLVYNAYPNKEIWFTECSGYGNSSFSGNIPYATINLYFGAVENWARTVLHWNLVLNSTSGPHYGGCTNCRGIITLQDNNIDVIYNEEYYGLAMISKFLVLPAYRLSCTLSGGYGCMYTMCIKNADGSVLIILGNFCGGVQNFAVQNGASYVQVSAAVGLTTFIW